jgi:hypothetical protein
MSPTIRKVKEGPSFGERMKDRLRRYGGKAKRCLIATVQILVAAVTNLFCLVVFLIVLPFLLTIALHKLPELAAILILD